MKLMKAFLLITAITFVSACGNEVADSDSQTVGISMPSQALERWENDGGNMQSEFEELGYETQLQFAEDDVDTQNSQVENMLAQGVDVLVIAPIDGEAMTEVLEQAENMEVPVIAYDRLLMNSEHVSYYATFDNFEVGATQGEYIEENLGLNEGGGPFNIELFAGPLDDNNTFFYWDGAMSVLEPYIESGDLNILSDQTSVEQAAIPGWDGAEAQERMDNLLSGNYSDEQLDAVLSPNDSVSLGLISSLQSSGYGSGDEEMPIITGQDAEVSNVQSIIAGEQTQTVFKDTRELANQAVDMVESVLEGEEPEVNDTESYDNGARVVPTYLVDITSVDESNYEEVLIDSDYYSEEDLN